MKKLVGAFLIGLVLTGCARSKITMIGETGSRLQSADSASSLKVFLLERDIPVDIERLGVVTIGFNPNGSMSIYKYTKSALLKECQKVGANGAYRINDGTYYPVTVSYLVFRYKNEAISLK